MLINIQAADGCSYNRYLFWLLLDIQHSLSITLSAKFTL